MSYVIERFIHIFIVFTDPFNDYLSLFHALHGFVLLWPVYFVYTCFVLTDLYGYIMNLIRIQIQMYYADEDLTMAVIR